MSIIKLQDLYFKPYISEEEIAKIVKQLAKEVKADLPKGEIPIFVGILNGCFLFAADFIRQFNGNCEISFVKLASYNGTASTEKVKQLVGINEDLTGKTVIIKGVERVVLLYYRKIKKIIYFIGYIKNLHMFMCLWKDTRIKKL